MLIKSIIHYCLQDKEKDRDKDKEKKSRKRELPHESNEHETPSKKPHLRVQKSVFGHVCYNCFQLDRQFPSI